MSHTDGFVASGGGDADPGVGEMELKDDGRASRSSFAGLRFRGRPASSRASATCILDEAGLALGRALGRNVAWHRCSVRLCDTVDDRTFDGDDRCVTQDVP